MSKSEPSIQKYMTVLPNSIQAKETMKAALDLMAEHQIRHLPVMDGEEVVGILSDRDLKMASSIQAVDPQKTLVADLYHKDPYKVDSDALLSEVAETMAQEHYGSALVISNNKLVGIFTTVDACRALHDIILQRHH